MTNLWQKAISKGWEYYSHDVGKSLIHLGAVGWFFSTLAQVVMIASNKDIDKKEKKFLIPQETADMAINVGLYYTICQVIKSIGDKALENGRIITQKTADIIRSIKVMPTDTQNTIKSVVQELKEEGIIDAKKCTGNLSSFFEGFTNIFAKKTQISKDSLIKPCLEQLLKNKTPEEAINLLKTAKDEFLSFKNGFGVLTAVGASILACNIITPIARNKTANYYQKMALKKQSKTTENPVEINKMTQPQMEYRIIKTSSVFNNFRI